MIITTCIIAVAYLIFIVTSLIFGIDSGIEIGYNFLSYSKELLLILPCAFIMIGLFEVWIKRETVEQHLGQNSGFKGYFWAIMLSGTTIGGILVSFPVACSLQKKGARLSVVFTYISASAIGRIPMTIFEASFIGIKFSLIRLFISIPLVILSSMLLEKLLENSGFKISEKKRIVQKL
ncbi:MAG: permease [bacterium]